MSNPTSDALTVEGRRVGRTTAMLLALPTENTPTVVVHSQAMADFVRNRARQVRPDLRHPIRVRIVQDVCDCDYLRGLDFVVDHAVLDQASTPVFSMLRALDRRRRWEGGTQPTAGLGVVDATVERDDSGAIKSVTLPGHDWS